MLFISFYVNLCFGQKKEFTKVDAFSNYKNHTINSVTEDSYHQLWFATSKGILKFDGKEIKQLNIAGLENIQNIFTKSDSIFFSNNQYLFLKTKSKINKFETKPIHTFFSNNKKIFVGTQEGVYYINNDYLQPVKISHKIDFSIIKSISNYKNQVYLGTNSGFWKLDNLVNPKQIQKIDDGDFSSIKVYNHKLYILKNNHELLVFNQDKLSKVLEKENIKSFVFNDQELIINTVNNGLTIYNSLNFSFIRNINKYNSKINFEKNSKLFEDQFNTVWIINDNSVYYNKSSSIIDAPNLFFEHVKINYNILDTISINNYKKVLQLSADENNISFSFNSSKINQSKPIEYLYILNNKKSSWDTTRQVDFPNLSSGKYTFTVISRYNGELKENKKTFQFYIDSPIYKKPWFIILSIAFTFLVLALAIDKSIKIKQKKYQEKIATLSQKNKLLSLEQKALQLQMNPHFIFNVLNSIKALGKNNNISLLNNTIANFSKLLRNILNNSRLEEISLQEEIETLKVYLELEHQMSRNFNYIINTSLQNIDTEEILLPTMLIQPFVENSIKHAFNSQNKTGLITINFEVDKTFLYCSIIDDGIGINHSKTKSSHKSVAIEVTKERIKNLSKHSKLIIEEIKQDSKVLGTKISIKIPLKTDF